MVILNKSLYDSRRSECVLIGKQDELIAVVRHMSDPDVLGRCYAGIFFQRNIQDIVVTGESVGIVGVGRIVNYT